VPPLKPHDDLFVINVLELHCVKWKPVFFDGELKAFDHLVPEISHCLVALLDGGDKVTPSAENEDGGNSNDAEDDCRNIKPIFHGVVGKDGNYPFKTAGSDLDVDMEYSNK